MLMNQYAMVVIGGSYEDTLLDPTPVPESDSIWSFDPESGHWSRLVPKNRTAKPGSEIPGHEVTPWNLVHHSAFKIDSVTIGVLWYDPETVEGKVRRNLMTSTFNCKTCQWRNLKVAGYGVDTQGPALDYRFFSSLLPIYDEECDRVTRVLVLGGFTMEDSLKKHTTLPLWQIDFTSKADWFEQPKSEARTAP